MSPSDRWHYKFTAAQFHITTPEGEKPTPKELKNAAQAAKNFNEVLQGGVRDNYIYTHKKDGQKYFATNAVSRTTLSTLRDHVNQLPIGSVLMQYGNNDDNDPSMYAGARRPNDPRPKEELAQEKAIEQDFAETLKFLAEDYMSHETKFADAYASSASSTST